MSLKMIAVGANPAYQKLTEFESLNIDHVNRATSLSVLAAGKGQNFARAACNIQTGICAVAHFLGGTTGKWINENLTEQSGKAVPQLVSWVESQTRTCTTLKDLKGTYLAFINCREINDLLCLKLEAGTVTEIIDPSGPVSPEEATALLRTIEQNMESLEMLAICGTCPPGLDDLYLNISKIVGQKKAQDTCLFFLDGYKSITNILETGLVDIYKVALYELMALTGMNLDKDGSKEEQLMTAVDTMYKKYSSLKWLAVTDGPASAYLFCFSNSGIEVYKYNIKPLDKKEAVNPIGAGDTVGGVMMAKYLHSKDMPSAFKWGLAAATAKCKLPYAGGVFDQDDLKEIFEQVEVCQLK